MDELMAHADQLESNRVDGGWTGSSLFTASLWAR